MKRYETYKDSGILWLDAIPSHWHEEKLKHISTCNDEVLSEDTPDELIIHYVEISDVDSVSGINNHTDYTFANAPSRARRITRKNDVIISTVRTYLKAIATVKEDDLIVSTGFAVIRPTKVNQKYLAYSLLNDDFLGEVISKSVGVSYPAINATDLIEIKIPVPPREEQETIAAFLDHKVGQIDATIAEKEQMLEDLKNYRSAIISEAVTKGLDKNVEMKDSGIEWMGRVPKHWKISKLKYAGAFDNGLTYSPEDVVEKGILVLRSSNIQNGHLSFDDCVYVKNAPSDLMVEDGDIIICSRNGSANLVGKCAFVDHIENSSFGAFMMRFRPCIHKKFAFYAFQASTSSYKGLYSTSTINQITKAVIDQMFMVVPPIEEQERIADYIDKKITNIDSSLTEVDSQIADLKSYKSALITEAVTGKIDLRDWKPKEEKV